VKLSLLIASLGAAPFAASLLLYPKPEEIKPTPVRTESIRIIPLERVYTFAERWYFPYVTEIKVQVAKAEEPAPPEPVIRRQRSVKLDLCARHGMRKVNYGRRWRCRR